MVKDQKRTRRKLKRSKSSLIKRSNKSMRKKNNVKRRKTMRRKSMRRKTMRRRTKQYKQIGGLPMGSLLGKAELDPFYSNRDPLNKDDPDWMNDNDKNECSKCGSEFSFTRRRHHCRACGKLFCSECLYPVNWILVEDSSTIEDTPKGEQKICYWCKNPDMNRPRHLDI